MMSAQCDLLNEPSDPRLLSEDPVYGVLVSMGASPKGYPVEGRTPGEMSAGIAEMVAAMQSEGLTGNVYIHGRSFGNPEQWVYIGTSSEYLFRIGWRG